MGSTGDGGSRLTMSEQSGCESTQPTVSREKRLVVMPAGCPHLNVSMCLERYSTNSSVSCLRQVISAHERTCLPRSHCMECFYFKSAKLTQSWFNFAVSWPRENVAEIDFPSNSSDSLRLCKRRGNEEIHLSGSRFSLWPPVNWLTIYGWGRPSIRRDRGRAQILLLTLP